MLSHALVIFCVTIVRPLSTPVLFYLRSLAGAADDEAAVYEELDATTGGSHE